MPGRDVPILRFAMVLAATLWFCVGCASKVRTTRIKWSDLDETVNRMIDSLAGSDLLAKRSAEAERMTIMINRVENLTSDVIPISEQWMLVAKVRDAMPMQELARQRNVHFVITPERRAMLKSAGYFGDFESNYASPTHLMSARFESARRSGYSRKNKPTDIRTEYYFMRYEIANIATEEIQWSDRFEFKRESEGIVID